MQGKQVIMLNLHFLMAWYCDGGGARNNIPSTVS